MKQAERIHRVLTHYGVTYYPVPVLRFEDWALKGLETCDKHAGIETPSGTGLLNIGHRLDIHEAIIIGRRGQNALAA